MSDKDKWRRVDSFEYHQYFLTVSFPPANAAHDFFLQNKHWDEKEMQYLFLSFQLLV